MKFQHHLRTGIILVLALICSMSCMTKSHKVKLKQAEAFRNLGEAYMKQELYPAALKELLVSESMHPNDPFLQNDLGQTYLALEKPDLAILHFKKALEIKADYAPAINSLGVAYMEQKNWDAAIATFNELTKNLIYGTPHYPLSNLGFAYYNKKMYNEAAKYYQAALDQEPKFIIALRGLGNTYMEMGKTDKAIETFDRAVAVAPKLAIVRSDLAKACISAGDFDKAEFQLKKALELEKPDSPLAIEAEAILRRLGRE